MKTLLAIFFLFPIFCYSQNIKGFTLIFKGEDFDVYMDKNIKRVEENVYRANYIRMVYNSKYGVAYKEALAKQLKNPDLINMKYNRQTVLVDINNNQIRTIEIVYYSNNDIPIDSRKYESWDSVMPNTFSGIIYWSVKDIVTTIN